MEKYHIEKNTVQETLMITLFGYYDLHTAGVTGFHRFLSKVGDRLMKMQIVRMDLN